MTSGPSSITAPKLIALGLISVPTLHFVMIRLTSPLPRLHRRQEIPLSGSMPQTRQGIRRRLLELASRFAFRFYYS